MNLMYEATKLFRNADRTVRANSPVIFASLAVTGTLATAYLSIRATFKAAETIVEAKEEGEEQTIREVVPLIWTYYIPPVIAGATTIGCIVGGTHASIRKTAAAMTAYSLSERAFTEYRAKVVEQVGKNQDRSIRDKVAQDVVKESAGSAEVIITGTGDVLCCELHTRRYFKSDMETLRKAQNDINSILVNNLYGTLTDFYHLVGLSSTANSDNTGWDSGRLLELEFTTTLSEDGKPCIAFNYNYTKIL